MEFKVPELGEGIEQATVVRVLVEPGTSVDEGQELVEVETEKATMTIPATAAGKIDQVRVKPGDKVRVGGVLMTTTDGKAAPAKSETKAEQPKSEPAPVKREASKFEPAKAKAESADGRRVEFKLPDLGEGITGGTVVTVLVKPGESVEAEQPLLELETEKASIPIPSPAKGRIESIDLKPGQQVKVGGLLAVIAAEGRASERKPAAKKEAAASPAREPAAPEKEESRPPKEPQRASAPEADGRAQRNGHPVPASPATRRLARELGIDLHQVTGSAPGGRVSLDDLKMFVRTLPKKPAPGPVAAPGAAVPQLPEFSKYGPVERKPFSALRKAIARNVGLSWSIAPQVTQHDVADITELEAQRKRIVDELPKGAPKVTMTALAVKAAIIALKQFPHFNASYDPNAGENGELVVKKYYHIGIAVDTERGLLVPVIRDADTKGIGGLARDLAELAERARGGKLRPDEMRGGSFTITNLGGIGGAAFSPIINYPEVAILGLSRSSWQPAVRDGKIEPRLMLPLSLTYDHRVIDGADGARFCARIAALLSDPVRMLFES